MFRKRKMYIQKKKNIYSEKEKMYIQKKKKKKYIQKKNLTCIMSVGNETVVNCIRVMSFSYIL